MALKMFRTGAHVFLSSKRESTKLARVSFSFFLKKNKHSYTLLECHMKQLKNLNLTSMQ